MSVSGRDVSQYRGPFPVAIEPHAGDYPTLLGYL